MRNFDDQPITTPDADLFGFDQFAQIVAQSIARLEAGNGTVLAVNGPWGSGKSSVVNLVKHHLGQGITSHSLVVMDFRCWWFRGEEALALAFFRDLYAKVGASLGRRFKKSVKKFGSKILKAGSAASAGADLAGASGAGALASGVMDWLSGLFDGSETVDDLYQEIVSILQAQDRKFLIVIDDIDRLTPDEAMQMFRLIKSVGGLPNVIYLLVYDRQLAEATVANAFPSEGPHYLEKIVQASFDVPVLGGTELSQQLLASIATITGAMDKIDTVEFMNIFYDVVDPLVQRPRDMARLCNALALVWPTLGKDVFLADMLAVEAIRLFKFELYSALRSNKDMLCPSSRLGSNYDMQKLKAHYDQTFLNGLDGDEADLWRIRLTRLFPRLSEVWQNSYHGGDIEHSWNVDRRICSLAHFGTYFSFTLGADIFSQSEIDGIVDNLSSPDDLRVKLSDGLRTTRRNGMTKASLILDVLNQQAARISLVDAENVLKTVFAMAGELDVDADAAKGFSIGNNNLRIHWLLRRLLLERTSLEERSAILMRAAKSAALSWANDLHWSAFKDFHPREGKEAEPEGKCLLTEADTDTLGKTVMARILQAAEDGSLLASPSLARLLYSWRHYNDDDSSEIVKWTSGQLADANGVSKFAAAFTTHSWSHGMGWNGGGDRVAKRSARVHTDSLSNLFDLNALRARATEVGNDPQTPEADRKTVLEFLGAWERAENGDDSD
jgi:predicted KAP-like P-loop ATPase